MDEETYQEVIHSLEAHYLYKMKVIHQVIHIIHRKSLLVSDDNIRVNYESAFCNL